MSDRTVSGGGRLRGEIRVPGDKSVSHRALILGALADGTTQALGLAPGADVRSTRAMLEALGVKISGAGADAAVLGRGLGGLAAHGGELDAGNSGTTMRLMAGVLAGHDFLSRLTGDASLCRRPMERVAAPLRLMGATVELSKEGTAPMTIVGGELKGREYHMPVPSAQVKSAVILAGLHASGSTTVVERAATRDHTEKMLALFGARAKREGLAVTVEGGARLTGTTVEVPGDPSSAAFWAVAAALAPGSELAIRGVMANPTRTGYLKVLERMGAGVTREKSAERAGEDCEDLIVRAGQLRATNVPAAEVPGLVDEVPILALAAACAEGTSRFHGLDELRHKESDRLAGIAELLESFGAKARVDGDDLLVEGTRRLQGATVESLDDHRLAMTGFVAGFLAQGETTVLDADCAIISYPSFYDDFVSRREP
ncbi:MAG TPA: 3-phosphoshikimate 1-carboxyvinyltransferase [Elusimicrobiota bacterium]|jgi:3-phosphoshikimate 1-carboxyvinyltransferase|nr:3-phosphoshikimate 1-carboxyvinyltransferase [Elusimicrobiota bacterium]